MDEEPIQPVKYMTVPEKIELKPDGGGYQDASRERYRPMKVPDKITLEATSAPPISGSGGESGRAAGIPHYPTSEVRKQGVPEATNVPLRNVQAAPNPQVSEPVANFQVAGAGIIDLERRVRTLEQQVQRLKETVVNSRPARGGTNERGYGFWYVLTFAGWMMVPLIMAFMYQSRRFR